MNAQELLRAGHLDEAIAALGSEIRERPSDTQRRMFLFELLCLAGNYDRAEKQLAVLAQDGETSRAGAWFYQTVLDAERLRQTLPLSGECSGQSGPGAWNEHRFTQIEDADPRYGSRFEFISPTGYHHIPIREIASVEMEAPTRLRHLIWSPARIQFRRSAADSIEVLIPVLTVGASKHPDPKVRLGRVTIWEQLDGVAVPCGQRLFQSDVEAWPVLEMRKLVLDEIDA
jgi:type VI secretion system protein ImpE